jgi:energy-coupling factor transporter ATP-binding protein EcfA2
LSDPDEALRELRTAGAELAKRTENEAETRHKVIDVVLHDVLGWPRNRVSVEEYIRPGFADYVLKKANGDDLLFIEAKRSGIFFTLPVPHNRKELSCYLGIQQLMSDENIRDAMSQVRTYCVDTGCEFAAITNGHEWIFFKTFEKGKRWDALKAFVVRKTDFFEREYTKAINSFSYTAVTEDSSLSSLLTSSTPKDRTIYFAKDRIPSYSHSINANRLAAALRPVVNHYFGVIGDDDPEFMDRCYVSQRDYHQALDGMRNLIQDSLTPYLASYGVQQLEETGKGGRLGGRLTKSIKKGRKGEVLVLFGGKGAGKSTFIKRLLHHTPPRWLREHSVIAIIDLLRTPEDPYVIRSTIWNSLVSALDTERLLSSDRDTLLKTLFADRFAVAARQELSGLPKASESYNSRLNGLVSDWKSDKAYCAQRLVDYWKDREKGIIVVVDNTDQFSGNNQDFCFTSAQEIADELGCITLISMREERFYNSKIHGLLDAFQNAGFHISSPKPAEVFRKRLSYTISILRDPEKIVPLLNAPEDTLNDSAAYLGIVNREFSSEQSPLNKFLSACAHGDTRFSLDLFRSFLLSGYTNVDEMLGVGRWNFQVHQIVKPVMIPNRYFYDESISDIPNIYQLRYSRHSSHFTGLRILRKLAKAMDGSSVGYLPLSVLKSYFVETFNMLDDLTGNLDILLKHGFVESSNRLDYYSDDVDSLRITNYGIYMLGELASQFTYLDLVCTDTGIYEESVSNYLVGAAKDEYNLFLQGNRLDRVRVRLDRVEKFITYLGEEEMRERDAYSLNMPHEEMFTYKASSAFQQERKRVLASAAKQKSNKVSRSVQ